MEFHTVLWDGGKLNEELFIECQKQNTLVLAQYNAKKREVRLMDTSRVRIMMNSISEIGAPARGSLLFSISGYDFDVREISEIPEAAAFIRQVVEEHPHIFYFMSPEVNQHMISSIVPHTLLPSPHLFARVQLDIPAAEAKFSEISSAVMAYGVSIGDTQGAEETLRLWRKTLNL